MKPLDLACFTSDDYHDDDDEDDHEDGFDMCLNDMIYSRFKVCTCVCARVCVFVSVCVCVFVHMADESTAHLEVMTDVMDKNSS